MFFFSFFFLIYNEQQKICIKKIENIKRLGFFFFYCFSVFIMLGGRKRTSDKRENDRQKNKYRKKKNE